MYPSKSQYKSALVNGMFPEKENGGYSFEPLYNGNEPILSSGGNAIVFKVTNKQGDHSALKLFNENIEGRFSRLTKISQYLENTSHSFFTPFKFVQKLIYVNVDDLPDDDKFFPGVVMKWIEGESLETKLKKLVQDKDLETIRKIGENFKEISIILLKEGIAHGDLKLSNILVDENLNLTLIDYDGMFVPTLAGEKAIELGTPTYQHLNRELDDYNSNIDHFSILLIYTSLIALTVDPLLYETNNDGDNIIFNENDFKSPNDSTLFNYLLSLKEIKGFVYYLKLSALSPFIYIEDLINILNGIFPKPKISISQKPLAVLSGDKGDLVWTTENCTYVRINGDELAIAGSNAFTFVDTNKFFFEYGNELLEFQEEYLVNCYPKPQIISFSANSQDLKFDEELILSWSSTSFSRLILKYNQFEVDVTELSTYKIKDLGQSTDIKLLAFALETKYFTETIIKVNVYYPIDLYITQDKKVVFPHRPVKLTINATNTQKTTLEPLGVDLTGKNEYNVRTKSNLYFSIVAENKRYKQIFKGSIEVLSTPKYDRKIVELPKLNLNIPSPIFQKINNVDSFTPKYERNLIKINKILDAFNLFSIISRINIPFKSIKTKFISTTLQLLNYDEKK